MRDFLNGILTFIAQANLTDAEFNSVTAEFAILDENTFNDLSRILAERENVSSAQDRLVAYYKAGGDFDFSGKPNPSEIFIGGAI